MKRELKKYLAEVSIDLNNAADKRAFADELLAKFFPHRDRKPGGGRKQSQAVTSYINALLEGINEKKARDEFGLSTATAYHARLRHNKKNPDQQLAVRKKKVSVSNGGNAERKEDGRNTSPQG